jgi:photosystem II stability/assembly factor-like uncharacterized protein
MLKSLFLVVCIVAAVLGLRFALAKPSLKNSISEPREMQSSEGPAGRPPDPKIVMGHRPVRSVVFGEDGSGIAAAGEMTYWITEDGGQNWKADAIGGQHDHMPPGSPDIVAATITSLGKIYALGQSEEAGSSIFFSRDRGKTWDEDYQEHTVFNDVDSIGEEGWIVGAVNTVSVVLHTTGDGRDWERIWQGRTHELLTAVKFIDAKTGWCVGYGGLIMHTIDGGRTWSRQPVPTHEHFLSVSFFDDQNGFAAGLNGALVHTSDGGKSWIIQAPPVKVHLQRVLAVDRSDGWAVGASGTVLHTTDAGRHWVRVVIDTNKGLYGLALNQGTIWISGSEGEVFRIPRAQPQ